MQTEKKKTSIWIKILYGIGIALTILILIGIIFPFDYYKHGMEEFRKGNYEKAFEFLNRVKSDNKNFNDAVFTLKKIPIVIDSLNKVKDLSEKEISKKIEAQREIETEKNEVVEKEKNRSQLREKFKENCLSAWDGSCTVLETYIKDHLKDPDSYKHIDTGVWDKGDYSLVELKYRAKNSFGGYVVESVKAKVSWDCQLLEIVEVIK